jgi:acetyl-CoA carboxylase biotin carboxyl carrier protein
LSEKKTNRKSAKAAGNSAAPVTNGGGPMDLGMLEKLVHLMRANDLSCVEVADGDRRILLKRGGEAMAFAPAPSAAPAAKPAAPPAEETDLITIKSIMVGTFYAAASPDSPPFVQVGSRVDEESDVCVIEAMKVFNTIKAECRGTIAKILVNNGQTVEFGQALFLVKP